MQARRILNSSPLFATVRVSPSPTERTRQKGSGRWGVGAAAGVVRGVVVCLGVLGEFPPLWQW